MLILIINRNIGMTNALIINCTIEVNAPHTIRWFHTNIIYFCVANVINRIITIADIIVVKWRIILL